MSDERVYADFSDDGIVWIGRHDNAMGPGKGSSIRQLLPEEAVKMARLLIREPDQALGTASAYVHPMGPALCHANNMPIDMLPTTANGRLVREDEMYFMLARQVETPGSPFRHFIEARLPDGLTWENLEYVSSNFPWGYTGGNVDFMMVFRGPEGRAFLVIVECKPDSAHDEAVLQAMLYIERALQVSFLRPGVAPPGEVEVLPLVICRALRRIRDGSGRLALPASYTAKRKYWGGGSVKARIRSPVMLAYAASAVAAGASPEWRDAVRFTFAPVDPARTVEIDWKAHPSSVGTGLEMAQILAHSWAKARETAEAPLPPIAQ